MRQRLKIKLNIHQKFALTFFFLLRANSFSIRLHFLCEVKRNNCSKQPSSTYTTLLMNRQKPYSFYRQAIAISFVNWIRKSVNKFEKVHTHGKKLFKREKIICEQLNEFSHPISHKKSKRQIK